MYLCHKAHGPFRRASNGRGNVHSRVGSRPNLDVFVAALHKLVGGVDIVLDLVQELALLLHQQRKVHKHLVQLRDGLQKRERKAKRQKD